MRNQGDAFGLLLVAAMIVVGIIYHRRRKLFSTEFGSAFFAYDKLLTAWGMLAGRGLILGRTLTGYMIRIPDYCHTLLIGATGSGKGVGIIIPNLLSYIRGAVICFDTKGDLYTTTARRRSRMGKVIRLSPFGEGGYRWNPLDTIKEGPLLIDHARSMAQALVVRPPGGAREPHWDDYAAIVITGVLVFVLIRLPRAERNLNSVQDVISDHKMLQAVAIKLKELGGIPKRLGGQIDGLFDKDGSLTKEGSGVMSTVARHLDFLNSELVAASVSESTFDVQEAFKPRNTLFLQIPENQLEAQRGLLRLWISTLIREIGACWSESKGEVLMMIDEADSLSGLSCLETALVRGRSAGARILLAYQSDSQVVAAFRDKPSLIYDNCSTQIYLGACSIESAERISKMLGSWTQPIQSYGDNWGESRSDAKEGGRSMSWGGSSNLAPQGRPLMYPHEVLRMSDEYLIVFQGGFPAPVFARKIRWYADPAFVAVPKSKKRWRFKWFEWHPERLPFVLCFLIVGFFILAGMRQPVVMPPQYEYEPKQKRGEPSQKSKKGVKESPFSN